jgi:hypothetical protein
LGTELPRDRGVDIQVNEDAFTLGLLCHTGLDRIMSERLDSSHCIKASDGFIIDLTLIVPAHSSDRHDLEVVARKDTYAFSALVHIVSQLWLERALGDFANKYQDPLSSCKRCCS